MFLYCLFIFAVSTSKLYTNANFLHSPNAPSKDVIQKNDLMKIIHSLNHFNVNLKLDNKEYKKMATKDKSVELSDFEKEKKLQGILSLIKKNYNAQKQYNLILNPVHTGARLYLIRNPDAIEEYKKYLEQKKHRSPRKQNMKNKLQELRRNVVFRIDSNDPSEDENYFDKTEVNAEDGPLLDKNDDQKLLKDDIKEDNERFVDDDNLKEIYDEPPAKGKLPADSLELHNKEVHQNGLTNKDFRREKLDWDYNEDRKHEKEPKWGSGPVYKYHGDNVQSGKKSAANKYEKNNKLDEFDDKFETVTYKYKNNDKFKDVDDEFKKIRDKTKRSKKAYDFDNFDKYTTKEYYKIKNDKPKYKKAKKGMRNDFSVNVHTSIPYVGKKGIYEDE